MAFINAPLTVGDAVFRIALAVALGGLIGFERGVRSHPAGFRTHILVRVGACLAMLTNQFVYQEIGDAVDVTRMGAQVISGIGFLGVGTIFMTGRNTVKGLTTAAGLWASGAIGLATGIGFYTGAIIAGIIVLVVLGLFPIFENYMYRMARGIRLHVEFDSIESEKKFVGHITSGGSIVKAKSVESITNKDEARNVIALYTIRLKKGVETDAFILDLSEFTGVRAIEIQY